MHFDRLRHGTTRRYVFVDLPIGIDSAQVRGEFGSGTEVAGGLVTHDRTF